MPEITTTPPDHRSGFSPQFPERNFYLMVYLLMGIGLRLREVLALKPEAIDLHQRIVTVTSSKDRTTREVPIPPDLHGILATHVQEYTHVRPR